MSIEIKNVETSEQVPEKRLKFDAQVYEEIINTLQEQANGIIGNAMKQGVQISQKLVNEVKQELYEINKSANKIMNVKINDSPVVKLEQEAVPYLGRMIINAKQKINTLLVGPAGSGKTFSAGQLAKALNLKFGHLNLTAGASETWLFGRQTPNGFIEGKFSELYRTGGVFLADEIDAADANLMLSINTAIANESSYNPINGETIPRHKDFVFVGAANTYGKGGDHKYTGRSRLDAATLDRFVMIAVDYNRKVEEALCCDDNLRTVLWRMRDKLVELQAQEFISSRCMQIAYLQWVGGISIEEILESITLSWPKDIKDEVMKNINVKETKHQAAASPKKKSKNNDIPF